MAPPAGQLTEVVVVVVVVVVATTLARCVRLSSSAGVIVVVVVTVVVVCVVFLCAASALAMDSTEPAGQSLSAAHGVIAPEETPLNEESREDEAEADLESTWHWTSSARAL